MARILVTDDEARFRHILILLLRERQHEVFEAASGEEALSVLERCTVDLLVLDLHLPDIDGMEVLRRVCQRGQPPASLLLTGHATVPTAIEAARLGAFDYLAKPFPNGRFLQFVERALEQRPSRVEVTEALRAPAPDHGFHEIIGVSPAIRKVFSIMGKVAPVKATVLVTGESGTGKELVARAIHRRSPRHDRNFVAVNCSAIPPTLVESEFFGHEKGAFTDACSRRTGRFEEADGGSLFLDEVGDLAGEAQAKLLRALQDQQIIPVGGGKPRKVDVRVIAATNKDLAQEVRAGRFRSDLFWRLNVVPIKLPPLRERKDDLPFLWDFFLLRFNGELGYEVESVSPQAQDLLTAYDWPGNIRELENTICRSMILCDGRQLQAGDLPARLQRAPDLPLEVDSELDDLHLAEAVRQATERLEKKIIVARLARYGWNRKLTAESLGISRKTLFNKLRQYGSDC